MVLPLVRGQIDHGGSLLLFRNLGGQLVKEKRLAGCLMQIGEHVPVRTCRQLKPMLLNIVGEVLRDRIVEVVHIAIMCHVVVA